MEPNTLGLLWAMEYKHSTVNIAIEPAKEKFSFPSKHYISVGTLSSLKHTTNSAMQILPITGECGLVTLLSSKLEFLLLHNIRLLGIINIYKTNTTKEL